MVNTQSTVAPSRKQSITQSLQTSVRRILVQGAPGCGKSTLSLSASHNAGDTMLPKERVQCTDVAVIQGDTEGMLGAYHAGFDCPNIYDMTGFDSFDAYKAQLLKDVRELRQAVKDKAIKYIVIDLALPNRLLQMQVRPGNQADWGTVSFEGTNLYHLFESLRGATIIGNVQMKLFETPTQSVNAAAAQQIAAVGGMVNTFVPDLTKGVGHLWRDSSSLTISIERKRVRESGKPSRVENTLFIEANGKYEAKSRFGGLLDASLPGTMTLHSILKKGYGDAL